MILYAIFYYNLDIESGLYRTGSSHDGLASKNDWIARDIFILCWPRRRWSNSGMRVVVLRLFYILYEYARYQNMCFFF